MKNSLSQIPTLDEAIEISLNFKIPFHPKYLYYWDQITYDELKEILQPTTIIEDSILYPKTCKQILEKLGTPHKIENDQIVLTRSRSKNISIIYFLENHSNLTESITIPELISKNSGIIIRNKFSTSVGVRIGRPEKAAPRQMKPAVHSLFPVGTKGGPTRDLRQSIKF